MGNWDRVCVDYFLTLRILCLENKIVKEEVETSLLEMYFKIAGGIPNMPPPQ